MYRVFKKSQFIILKCTIILYQSYIHQFLTQHMWQIRITGHATAACLKIMFRFLVLDIEATKDMSSTFSEPHRIRFLYLRIHQGKDL